jgi:hypothetical protein
MDWKNFFYQMKRVWIDLFWLGSVGAILLFAPIEYFPFPYEDRARFMSLFLNKLVFVSAGMLHAHIGRMWYFPNMGVQSERRVANLAFMAVWYGVIVWAWARGG